MTTDTTTPQTVYNAGSRLNRRHGNRVEEYLLLATCALGNPCVSAASMLRVGSILGVIAIVCSLRFVGIVSSGECWFVVVS